MAKLLSGTETSKVIRAEIKEKCAAANIQPCICAIVIGDRKDSATYIRMKKRACEEVGIKFIEKKLEADISQQELSSIIQQLNLDASVHGILIQLPVPEHIDAITVTSLVAQEKDVDGLSITSAGRLAKKLDTYPPCTPRGCIELLKRYNIPIEGKTCVIIGRSQIVGTPMSAMMLAENATVIVCHSRTPLHQLQTILKNHGDIVVASVGKAQFVQGSWLKDGAVVLDVGINAVDDSTRKRGYKLVGDVDFSSAKQVASYITPVPGGCGPMTVAMLLQNTLDAALIQQAKK